MIEIYTDATANGLKVSIGLEELGLKYKAHRVFLGGEQMMPEFTALNPNNKIPVPIDDDVEVSESDLRWHEGAAANIVNLPRIRPDSAPWG